MDIIEGDLRFVFPKGIAASKYDDWSFYRNQFLKNFDSIGGVKAVDIIVIDQVVWFIEVKDYRLECKTNARELADVIAIKVRDTLAGLVAAKNNANDAGEREIARQVLKNNKIRVVLHMEQPTNPSKLHPNAINPANIKLKLKQRLKSIDAHPLVVDKETLHHDMPWKVS